MPDRIIDMHGPPLVKGLTNDIFQGQFLDDYLNDSDKGWKWKVVVDVETAAASISLRKRFPLKK